MKNYSLLKKISILFTGSLISQLINFSVIPILSRLYTPSEYGMYSFYLSLYYIFSIISMGRYDLAIFQAKTNKEAIYVLQTSILLSVLFMVSFYMLSPIIYTFINFLYNEKNLSSYFFLIPLHIFIANLGLLLYNFYNREGVYSKLFLFHISSAITKATFSILLKIILKLNGLIISLFIASFSSFLVLSKDLKIFKMHSFSVKKMFFVLNKYKKYPKYSIASGFLENFSAQLPTLIIVKFFGMESAGYYFMARNIAIIPTSLISSTFAKIFREEASKEFRIYQNAKNTWKKFLAILLVVSFLISLMFLFCAFLVPYFLGEKWVNTSLYIQLLIPIIFFQILVSPLSSILFITNKQEYDLFMNIALFIGMGLVAILAYVSSNIKLTLLSISLVYLIKYSWELYLSYKFARGKKHG